MSTYQPDQFINLLGYQAKEIELAFKRLAVAMSAPNTFVLEEHAVQALRAELRTINAPYQIIVLGALLDHQKVNQTANRPDGWYRQFEKKNGKRNLK